MEKQSKRRRKSSHNANHNQPYKILFSQNEPQSKQITAKRRHYPLIYGENLWQCVKIHTPSPQIFTPLSKYLRQNRTPLITPIAPPEIFMANLTPYAINEPQSNRLNFASIAYSFRLSENVTKSILTAKIKINGIQSIFFSLFTA